MAATVYYDGECPFCAQYATLVRLRETVGPVRLVDVRQSPIERMALEREGYNLDQEMVLDLDGQRFAGADALHQLSVLGAVTSAPGVPLAIFRSRTASRLLYPCLRAGRQLALFALGRSRIAVGSAADRAFLAIFCHAWGLYAFLHMLYCLYYQGEGTTQVSWSTWAMGGLGALLMVKSRSWRVLGVLTVVMLYDAWLQMPGISNHAILQNFVLVAILLSSMLVWVRGGDCSHFANILAPVGRALLGTMYVFGVFHKLNTGFLNPDVSCAVAVWQAMPYPLDQLNFEWFKWVTILGTLVVETAILCGLLAKRARHLAIVSGIAFHGLIALSGYDFYPAFTMLAISLHTLYLSPDGAMRIVQSSAWHKLEALLKEPRGLLILLGWLGALGLVCASRNTTSLGLLWLPWAIGLTWLVVKYGGGRQQEAPESGFVLRSPSWSANVLAAVFFLNCCAPYLGLKTAQSMNMFANLSLEGGRSNHLILSGAPGPFPFVNDTVRIVEARGSESLAYIRFHGWHITYYDLLKHLDRDRTAVVTFERQGVRISGQTFASLRHDMDSLLHSVSARKLLVFRPFDTRTPRRCGLTV